MAVPERRERREAGSEGGEELTASCLAELGDLTVVASA
jgi:hypothetical protein